jgi:hypothetical protein
MTSYPRIISLSGFQGSGKDTAADILCERHGYTRISFASTLKDAVSAVFGWDREMLEGRTAEARAAREQVDEWWSTRLQMPGLTPRRVLQEWGTDVLRNNFHADIWVASLERKLMTAPADARFVITDCRFPNEINVLRNLEAAIWWIHRGPHPDWMHSAIAGNIPPGVHISEVIWLPNVLQNCIQIENNDTLDALSCKIKNILNVV